MVLKVELEKTLERKFREAAMKRYGFQRGAFQKATEDAIKNWLSTEPSVIPRVDDPFPLVEGILKKLKGKKTSVQLQHETKQLWTRSL